MPSCGSISRSMARRSRLVGRPAPASRSRPGGARHRRRRKVVIEHTGRNRIAAAIGHALHLQHPHPAIERHRDDVAGPHRAARRIDPRAVEADMAAVGKLRGVGAGAHHARVPQPFVDALTIQTALPCPRLPFLVGLELLLQGQQLGERRIRIGLLAARSRSDDDQVRAVRLSSPRSRSRRGGRSPRSPRGGRSCRSGRL